MTFKKDIDKIVAAKDYKEDFEKMKDLSNSLKSILKLKIFKNFILKFH